MNYYNEFDPHAAAWLRQLIAEGMIPPGEVDTRSITDVQPNELTRFTQCHFFAGIGGWSLALQLAGWPIDKPVWTGSCPCQPFSVAGKGKGSDDERHLWPAFFNLIRECRPDVVFGEQVESAIGHGWLDGIRADLEGEGYACGDCTLGAHSAGADHQRQRLYWVANSIRPGLQGHGGHGDHGNQPGRVGAQPTGPAAAGSATGGRMGDPGCAGYERRGGSGDLGCQAGEEQSKTRQRERSGDAYSYTGADDSGMGHSPLQQCGGPRQSGAVNGRAGAGGGSNPWDSSIWIPCRDGKHRRIPTEPALFPLADGLPYKLARRGSIRPALLKGAGNAIVPQVAAMFIEAFDGAELL